MKGRKPLPTNFKVINGNPGKRPLNKDEPQFVNVLPDPPDFLTEKALAEWNRMGPKLVESGVVTEGDMAIFAAYCQSWARWKELEALQAKAPLILGEKVKNANGSTSMKFRHNRLLSELNQAVKFLNDWKSINGNTDPSLQLPFSADVWKGARTPCLLGKPAAMYPVWKKFGFTYDASRTGSLTWPKKVTGGP